MRLQNLVYRLNSRHNPQHRTTEPVAKTFETKRLIVKVLVEILHNF